MRIPLQFEHPNSQPFQLDRNQWTMFGGTWAMILGVCMVAGRNVRVKRYELKQAFRHSLLWKQLVTLVSISAFLWASTPEVFAAPTFNPIFYYYHNDNLGSSNVLTDRTGQMVQHYEYTTFGQSSFQDNTSAYQVSNRYTGQICDNETGLYYYGARYYDPQLGRFIQPDTIVPSATAPQTFNRYSYCDNNPLKFIDPTGHFFFAIVVALLCTAAIGAAAGAITAATYGGSIWKAAMSGALGAAFGFLGGPIGGIVGAAISAEITGGNIGAAMLGAAIGGVIGFGVGGIGQECIKQGMNRVLVNGIANITTGTLGGGFASMALGGNFATGAEYGATGAAISFTFETGYERVLVKAATRVAKDFSSVQKSNISNGLNTLASTRTGQSELWQSILEGRMDINVGDDLSAGPSPGERPPTKGPSIYVNPNNKFGLGEDEIARLINGGISPDETAPMTSGRTSDAWAVYLGHEMGHTLFDNYSDHGPGPALNIINIENPLRSQLGFEPRYHYDTHLVVP